MDDPRKAELRRRLRAARDDVRTRTAAQAELDRALMGFAQDLSLRSGPVALFSATSAEASPAVLGAYLRTRGIETVYPRVDGAELRFHVSTPSALTPGSHRILEPSPEAPEAQLGDIELFIVPGLGFTPFGDRLGYGGGYYDRTLAAARAARPDRPMQAVGVGFSVQLQETLPVEAHDFRLQGILTELGFRRALPRPNSSD